ncbi:methylmalonyl-CoA decarboxylase, delta subunit [Succiniclasticum ruminis]|jgi:glutaconyl-CoA decarboxylase|uniref:Methylmalonyl-CoA decarboxylase, delta subunit n=1 Tax=Succiniclasticum ruminis TaxID=40841 RepID=A0A1G6IX41_9FIRM|nr:OadG family transporter subunit [Succiniclasticum ruminis]MBQ1777492.1 OadG family protein [Acidaminococcaceae bacterium]MBQ2141024.1 OadG family protein [Acidaminococcaceae bacterium]MBQ2221778.1 OadG family protein [Acidaminococcaceae bacterium]SDC11057.1 methylmalonyl-CoA decarboxylase, delta subunit [Succiniclasticum ruminis]
MGPVTNNPFLIAIINMIVVFGVLIVLGFLMHVIEMIDPTKKKAAPKAAAPVAAPAAAPVAAPVVEDKSEEIAAVIAAAVAACGGAENVVAVRIAAPATSWAVGARAEAQTVQPFC